MEAKGQLLGGAWGLRATFRQRMRHTRHLLIVIFGRFAVFCSGGGSGSGLLMGSREHTIFECVMSKIFEEYRFFAQYPERELKIAATLFGSFVKCHLVTHMVFGITLRCVLDALRKPAGTNMYTFGTKAFEQFADRLHEWPCYCMYVSRIPEMRNTHPEIVAVIERIVGEKFPDGHGSINEPGSSSNTVNEGQQRR